MENADIPLISGTFECDDARDLLLGLINQKIQYHHLKNFSMQERFGIVEAKSESRIQELSKARLHISEHLLLAQSLGCKVSVNATISIQLLTTASIT